MVQAIFTALSSFFAAVTLILTFIHETDLYPLKISWQKKMNFLNQGFQKLLYYIHTYRQMHTENITMPLRVLKKLVGLQIKQPQSVEQTL